MLVILASCSKEQSIRRVDILNIAVLPDQSEEKLRLKYQPLLDHLKAHAGINSKLLIPASYSELLQWFAGKKVDMALFGGFTYVKAHLQNKAIPLVIHDAEQDFRSVILVKANHPANSLTELKGLSFSFGPELSTSGHIMPRYFMQEKNINPDTFFSKIHYSDAHDLTIKWIRDGKVDVGVVNSGILNEILKAGSLEKNKLKIIWKSPPFYDYVWAIQPDISNQQRIIIRNAFLHMNYEEEDKSLLRHLGVNYYMPSVAGDFRDLQNTMLKLEPRVVSP